MMTIANTAVRYIKTRYGNICSYNTIFCAISLGTNQFKRPNKNGNSYYGPSPTSYYLFHAYYIPAPYFSPLET